MSGTETHPSDLALDRGGPEFEAHVASCDHCRARAHAASQIRATFDNVVFPRTVAAVRTASRAQNRPRRAIWFLVGGPAALAAAGIVLVLAVGPLSPQPSDSSPASGAVVGAQGIKGAAGPPLDIVVKRGGDVFRLSDGRSLRPGDGLRFVYRGATPRQVSLLTRDRGGRLVRFFPTGATSALIRPGDTFPGAVFVDAAAGAEHVELWMSAEPFTAAETGSPPVGVTVYPIDLQKER